MERLHKVFFQIYRQASTFHLLAIILFLAEAIFLLLSTPFLFHSALFATALSFLLFTGFAFWIVRNYLQLQWKEESKRAGRLFVAHAKEGNNPTSKEQIESLFAFFRKMRAHFPTYSFIPHLILQFMSKNILRNEMSPLLLEILKTAERCAEEWVISDPLNLEAHGAFVEIHKAVAEELRSLGQETKAKQEESKAIEELLILRDIAPEDGRIIAELAKLYRKTEREEEEIALYEAWVKLDPTHEEHQVRLAKLLFKSGKKSQGFRLYHNLRQSNPAMADALLTTLFEH